MNNQALQLFTTVFVSLTAISVAPVYAQGVTADDVVCQRCIQTTDLDFGAVGTARIADGAINNRTVADKAIDGRTLANGVVGAKHIKNRSINTNKIVDDAVTPEKIADLVRTISVLANSLHRDPNNSVITEDFQGLRWQASAASAATYTLSKPADYAGGDVTMRLFFQTTTDTAGTVQFFVRADSFSAGEGWFDITGILGPLINVAGTLGFGTLYEEAMVIPAARLDGDWWTGRIQRNQGTPTYPDDVIVRAISFEYLAIQ